MSGNLPCPGPSRIRDVFHRAAHVRPWLLWSAGAVAPQHSSALTMCSFTELLTLGGLVCRRAARGRPLAPGAPRRRGTRGCCRRSHGARGRTLAAAAWRRRRHRCSPVPNPTCGLCWPLVGVLGAILAGFVVKTYAALVRSCLLYWPSGICCAGQAAMNSGWRAEEIHTQGVRIRPCCALRHQPKGRLDVARFLRLC